VKGEERRAHRPSHGRDARGRRRAPGHPGLDCLAGLCRAARVRAESAQRIPCAATWIRPTKAAPPFTWSAVKSNSPPPRGASLRGLDERGPCLTRTSAQVRAAQTAWST